MKKWWFGERKHIDQGKLETKAKAKMDLRNLIDTGDEEGYVDYIKASRPNLSPEEMVKLIELFRDLRRQNR